MKRILTNYGSVGGLALATSLLLCVGVFRVEGNSFDLRESGESSPAIALGVPINPGYLVLYEGPGSTLISDVVEFWNEPSGSGWARLWSDINGGANPEWARIFQDSSLNNRAGIDETQPPTVYLANVYTLPGAPFTGSITYNIYSDAPGDQEGGSLVPDSLDFTWSAGILLSVLLIAALRQRAA